MRSWSWKKKSLESLDSDELAKQLSSSRLLAIDQQHLSISLWIASSYDDEVSSRSSRMPTKTMVIDIFL